MLPDRQTIKNNLYQHVDRLAGLIGPRHLGAPQTMVAAAGLIERELSNIGYAIERQNYEALGRPTANLIAEIPGSRRRGEIVVLGAHYDTVWSTPGADDNASAV